MNDFLSVLGDFLPGLSTWKEDMFSMTILMSFLISSVYVLTKGVFLTVINMTCLIRTLR